jgi:hypothetical protein
LELSTVEQNPEVPEASIPPTLPSLPSGLQPGVLGRWWREGARGAVLRRPRAGLHAQPSLVVALLVAVLLLGILVQRLLIAGPAEFYAAAFNSGWADNIILLGLCWVVAQNAPEADQPVSTVSGLFALLLAQSFVIQLATAAVLVPLVHTGWPQSGNWPTWLVWGLWLAPWAWVLLAQAVLLGRAAWPRRRMLALWVVLGSAAMMALQWFLPPTPYWYAQQVDVEDADPPFQLTQEVMEAQPELRSTALQSLAAQRPGIVDVYAITFAPYAGEDVFRRESGMVAGVMRERFDAQGRTLQLVNHRDTALEFPWATPRNLRLAIDRIASVMDREEDVLFIHLTSHGAANGQLAAAFWPLQVEPVMPAALRQWLDDAGVRFRVISVSACYSGSWIEPLASEGSLIMTAADATHTSYGCGRLSELTFFGRAMYDEALRNKTLSFEQAHATARVVIDQREKEAGKTDGYSNPQISIGPVIRKQLARLEARLLEGRKVDDASLAR